MDIIDVEISAVYPIAGILLVMIYGYFTKKADLSGVFAGGLIALVLYAALQWQALIYFFIFFLAGSLASKWKLGEKERLQVAQENQGRRTAVHALSNAGAAALFACFAFSESFRELAAVSVAAVFAAALSDTLSSELGNILGKKYYNIVTLKPDKKGSDGAISFEGTLAGLTGSLIVGAVYYFFNSKTGYAWIVFGSGMAANFLDSFLGAFFQRRSILSNHLVNMIMTFFAGVLSFVLAYSFQ